MKIPAQGLDRDALFATLDEYRQSDFNWRTGRAWGYVYDAGPEAEEVAKEAYRRFLSVNGLDFTVFPSVQRLENELIAMCTAHLGGDNQVTGGFTSGGTESIILAVKAAREYARANRPSIEQPEMLLPVTGHAAFHKAAYYLNVRVVPVPVDKTTKRADVAAMADAINENTILLVGSATSYAPGVCDPIAEIGQLALKHDLLFHVDGCIGGFMIPYFKRLGAPIQDFDFSVPGVTSISMDLHKYAFAPKGASVVLYRNADLKRYQMFACSGWTGYTVVNNTIQSSKTGGPLAAAWSVLNFIGDEGYLKLAEKLWSATNRLCDGISAIDGLELMVRPEMSLIAVCSDSVNIFHVIDEMNLRGWYVQPQLGYDGHPPCMHLSVNPNQGELVDEFLIDLQQAVDAAADLPSVAPAPAMLSTLESIDPATLTAATVKQLLAMAGIQGTALPDRMAEINQLINAMPSKLSERILIEFVNEMFTPAHD